MHMSMPFFYNSFISDKSGNNEKLKNFNWISQLPLSVVYSVFILTYIILLYSIEWKKQIMFT